MSGHKIITIGRQFGSGGREIGQKLAERLSIPLYDRRLVSMAAESLGVRKEDAERVDESSLNTFVANYTVSPGMYMEYISAASYIQSFDEQVYRAEAEIIRGLAEKGPCIIVGRCADYILKDRAECINVFICADKDDRKKRIARLYNLTERKAAERIRRTDRERWYYYELHTGQDWGDITSHQILFNVSLLGMEKIVDYLELMYKS
ncbi:MAG TPA: cytidylate kinase-like family protein [Candidatus Mediterraneibacter intestinipullorum]|nr:cytidylate kinase-like family protein [Candidatus Mediterraneibacter intestinipullorum]